MTNTEAGGDLPEPSIAEQRAMSVLQTTSDEWDSKPSGASFLEKEFGKFRAVIDKRPELLRDKQGRVVGVDAWVRLFDDTRGREIPIDPHRRIINPPTVPRSGIVEEDTGELDPLGNPIKRRILTSDPMRAFYEAVRDSIESEPNAKGWRTRGTVTTVFGDTADGYISSQSLTYATARTGGTLTMDNTATSIGLVVGQVPVSNFVCQEAFVSFDTSAIADTDVVSVVTLDLWLSNDSSTQDFTVQARDYDWSSTLTTADWISGASLSANTLVASIASSGIGAIGAYKTLTSQAAFLTVTNIKTGTVHLVLNSDRHIAANSPVSNEQLSFNAADTSGTTNDPKLTITHATPPPAMPIFQRFPNRIWRLN